MRQAEQWLVASAWPASDAAEQQAWISYRELQEEHAAVDAAGLDDEDYADALAGLGPLPSWTQWQHQHNQATATSTPTPTAEPVAVGEVEATEADLVAASGPAAAASAEPAAFVPQSQEDLAPSGVRERAQANLAALELLQQLRTQQRAATAQELAVLARWGSWGAVPAIFDESNGQWEPQRARLRALLSEQEYSAARRTVLNAHYTDPVFVQAMWRSLERLGFAGGRVLEPGCGAGTFIGMAPTSAQMVGVELDPTSAGIAAALYPGAQVLAESFAETKLPRGYFDAAIGNVPFAKLTLHDPMFNAGNHSIHNHFILKSLGLVRPGGVAAFLTSRYTLDATNPAARREMHQLADLLGAVRLPSQAHRRAAGTDVVTDLLIFRRRLPGQEPGEQEWEYSRQVQVEDAQISVNTYFHEHPERMLGVASVQHGMYNAEDLRLLGDLDALPAQLHAQLDAITDAAAAADLGMTLADERTLEAAPRVATASEDLWDGHIGIDSSGSGFTQLVEGVHAPMPVPRAQVKELRGLLALRDLARQVLTGEADTIEDTDDLERLRSRLAASYQDYLAKYGPINRVKITQTGRVDAEGDAIVRRAVPPAMRTFGRDPFFALVASLEQYDEEAGTATPSTIQTQRVLQPRLTPTGADTAEEALALSLEVHGRPDLTYIAHLLGVDEQAARDQLQGLVFTDPGDGKLLAAAEYLSGNVIVKLDAARTAAAADPAFTENVQALEQVAPAPLGADEIEPRIGAVWVSPKDYEKFLAELVGTTDVTVDNPHGAMWEVKAPSTFAAITEWGTRRVPAAKILAACLEQRVVTVTDDVDGTRVPNPTATEAAREKQTAMQERFAEWVWEDPRRAARLVAEYNRRFNAIVLREYSAEGQRLRLPGLARDFTPEPHQRAAVARMINEPAVGLFHEVGAGKTTEMVMGVMELRRLGMANKPVVVVPNHMLAQFTREWLQRYPQARVLAASSEDLKGEQRRRFVARAATNDWDAIVMTRTAFQRIPVSKSVESDYQARELDSMRASLAAATDRNLTVKRLENKIAREEEKLKAKLTKPEDPGITFEQTGIDYVVVDEAHDYKNLRTVSSIQGAAIAGSVRASDLHMKLEHLRNTHGRRVATFATATPLANSVTEAHVMQRYLRPDLLQAAGVMDFDSWAGTFGESVTEIEMGVAGEFRQKTRFAKFQNVPEMLRMWHTFADVKTAEDLKLPIPDMAQRHDGQRLPVTALLEPTEAVTAYVAGLAERAEVVKSRAVDPSQDNMLKISSDGRKAALDLRLVDPTETLYADQTKVSAAAAKIAAIWAENKHRIYHDDTGEVSPVPGSLQIVFCDLGTPSQSWNVYDELRQQLVDAGIPPGQVRFIHEADKDAEKDRLFAACRAGHVSVLVGSTQKMGVGTNIQRRAVALHHLDCPWRPADLAQREGRILRRGNENSEVSIYRWVVEGSFDAYSWQTVERKARFINQVMRGRLDVREVEDIGDAALSYAEVKALASGNPLLIEREEATAKIAKLERLERAHHQNLAALGSASRDSTAVIERAERDLPLLRAAAERVQPTQADAFHATITGVAYTDRVQAGHALGQWIAANQPRFRQNYWEERALGVVAEVGGHAIEARTRPPLLGGGPCFALTIKGVPRTDWTVQVEHVQTGAGEGGLVRQIENHVASIPDLIPKVIAEQETAQRRREEVDQAKERPFKYADELAQARARLQDVDAQMKEREKAKHAETAQRAQDPETEVSIQSNAASLPLGHQHIVSGPEGGQLGIS